MVLMLNVWFTIISKNVNVLKIILEILLSNVVSMIKSNLKFNLMLIQCLVYQQTIEGYSYFGKGNIFTFYVSNDTKIDVEGYEIVSPLNVKIERILINSILTVQFLPRVGRPVTGRL